MRVLFDQGTPAPLRHTLVGHSVETAFDWLGYVAEGALMTEAENSGFDVLLTTTRT